MDRLAHEVIGAAIEVHRVLGPGYLESVYEGEAIGDGRLDLLVQSKLIVEIKTVEMLAPVHKAQVISYLKATGFRLALLINFNSAVLKDGIKRIILS